MVDVTIDGKPIAEFADDELVALNQELGRKTDAIRGQRMVINRELRIRRELGVMNAAAAAIGGSVQVIREGDSVSVVVPGAELEAKALHV